MVLKPVNRYVWVSVPTLEENTTESGIVLPDDFKPTQEKFCTAKVLSSADDTRFLLQAGATVIVDKSMVEEINVNNQLFTVVQDNYILGILSEG
tara:strand:- start:526 stop:807 length:282 start_codon:yes stop_codon:yes gene_type:complete